MTKLFGVLNKIVSFLGSSEVTGVISLFNPAAAGILTAIVRAILLAEATFPHGDNTAQKNLVMAEAAKQAFALGVKLDTAETSALVDRLVKAIKVK